MQRKAIRGCQQGKSFMKRVTVIILVCILFSGACKKGNDNSGNVNIRIENATNSFLEDVKVGDAVYGNVTTRMVTSYAVITTPVYAGYCNFRINDQVSGAGYGVCGTPMPPAFAPGYYTFKVEPVAGQAYFTVVVTKD
jgi:hypothetical protein